MNTPQQRQEVWPRPTPRKLPPTEYPDSFEVRKGNSAVGMRWSRHWVNVSQALQGTHVGLEQVQDGRWNRQFGVKRLGRLDERHMPIEDELGSLRPFTPPTQATDKR